MSLTHRVGKTNSRLVKVASSLGNFTKIVEHPTKCVEIRYSNTKTGKNCGIFGQTQFYKNWWKLDLLRGNCCLDRVNNMKMLTKYYSWQEPLRSLQLRFKLVCGHATNISHVSVFIQLSLGTENSSGRSKLEVLACWDFCRRRKRRELSFFFNPFFMMLLHGWSFIQDSKYPKESSFSECSLLFFPNGSP